MKISNLSYRVPSPQYRSTLHVTFDVYSTKSNKCHADRSNIMSLNNIAFHGLFSNNNPTTENRLNAAIQNLDDKSILIFADDLDKAKIELKGQLKNIDFPIYNIFFVENTFDYNSFAVYKDKSDKYKIFKINPLSSVYLLDGGKDENKLSVKKEYIATADDTSDLNSGKYIKISSYKNDAVFKVDFNSGNLKQIFDRYVDKSSFFENKENIEKFNSLRLSVNTSSQKINDISKKIKFSDIGGLDKQIEMLEENVVFPMVYPSFYKEFRLNKGILLYGPPRCGKTMLANALANELGINFIKVAADDLTDAKVGQTEKNWRKLFKHARENQPCLIFIDEFDAIAKQRSGSDQARYQDTVVNQLLVLTSDIEKSQDNVFVIAATNREDLIDKALLSSGRFGLKIEIPMPDIEGIKQIFDKTKKDKPVDNNIDKDKLCGMMFDNKFNGSDVVETFYIAYQNAMRRTGIYEKMKNRTLTETDRHSLSVNQADFEKAIEEIAAQK